MTVMGIVGNTLYQFIDGPGIEIHSTLTGYSKSDLMEYEGVKEYDSYENMIFDILSLMDKTLIP